MSGISNTIFTMVNFIFFIFGIIGMGTGLYILAHGDSHCQKLIQDPLIIMGFIVMVVSFLGLAGSCWKNNSFLVIYLIVIVFLIVGLIGFFIFGLLVTYDAANKAASGIGFVEYRLQDFSMLLQKLTVNKKNWLHIKSCLTDAEICNNLTHIVNRKDSDFYKANLSPLQSGCCKPPKSCNLEYQNATIWTVPKSGAVGNGRDCRTWNNNTELLCYDCNSCKAGFLANLADEYRELWAVCTILAIALLIFVFSIGSCARRNNKYRYVKYSPYISP